MYRNRKQKTKKTLMKRIKITAGGKVLRKSIRMGHLKVKLDSSSKSRKTKMSQVTNPEYLKSFRRLLGKAGKGIK